ncbi:MAG: pilus assembly protein TadG-related protein [Aestuariivirga sp.]|uniref:pilus assembly protein TadG-related protein n=1 Tax=Aestuariivirga sp. TaxID=2650926 RepID=UPI0030179399
MPRSKLRARKLLTEMHEDTGGAILIWVALVLTVLIGLIGLAIDGGRLFNLNSNLQEVADAAALAGAAELDGSSDAITRATDAAVNYLNNNPKWSDVAKAGARIVSTGTYKPLFYKTLNGAPTTNPAEAVYIKVRTVNREVSITFARPMFPQRSTGKTFAEATAKSSFSSCANLQSFMCNPWESEQTNKGAATNWMSKIIPGQMLKLVGGTNGAPGNWGLIEPPAANGNPHNQAGFWARMAPSTCEAMDFSQLGHPVDTGNNGPFAAPGMNVRFDNPQNQLTNTAAPIVIDGLEHTSNANAASCANTVDMRNRGAIPFKQTNEDGGVAYGQLCVVTTPASKRISCPLPRDRTMANLGGNSWSTSMIGTGVNAADLLAYWKNHHTGTTIPNFYDSNLGQYVPTTTRWQVYQMENNPTTYPSAAFTSDSIESSRPFCRDSKPAGDIKRRLINVAIVDCDY